MFKEILLPFLDSVFTKLSGRWKTKVKKTLTHKGIYKAPNYA